MTTDHPLGPLADLIGNQKIPGGCDDCNAYQTLNRDPAFPTIVHLHIHHDDTCPTLNRLHQQRTEEVDGL